MNSRPMMLMITLSLAFSLNVNSAELSHKNSSQNNKTYHISEDGTVRIPAAERPMSTALSAESKAAAIKAMGSFAEFLTMAAKDCPTSLFDATLEELPALRRCRAKAFETTSWYKDTIARYPSSSWSVEPKTFGSVNANIYTPKEGVSKANQHRVLIHLHGGAFSLGAHWVEKTAAMPVAVDGEFRVVSVDYRQYPEAKSPAALEDILVVYKQLLKDYRPENIGIYGCSAGGYLSGQSIAWINEKGLPTPGAVGMFGQGIASGSDSAGLASIGVAIWQAAYAKAGINPESVFSSDGGYFKDVDVTGSDPLAYFAGNSIELLRKYPPSLLITSSRDYGMSTTVATHSNLIKAGVEADLHVWEGLEHCFNTKHAIPETADAQNVIIRFFDKHLGRQAK
jgi:monoterpene epsilon-lactone hydrolase